MNKLIKITLLFSLCCFYAKPGNAQIENAGELIRGGVGDAQILINEYLRPLGNGFGADLNNGWYYTAKTHKFLGFDLTVSASAATAPSSDETFDVSTLGLQFMRPQDPNNTIAPTIVGDDVAGPLLDLVLQNPLTRQDEVVSTLQLPKGTGINYVPAPMIQASVGLPLNTDFILRFFPETEFEKDVGSVKMLGFGVKHSLNQWIPGGSNFPLDLAVLAGVTTLQTQADLDVAPDQTAIPSGASYDNQKVKVEANAFTFNLLASKKLAIFTLFGGIGIETSSLDLNLTGTYPATSIETNLASPNFGKTIIDDLEDPVALSFTGPNKMRASIGLRLDFYLLSAYASYTMADYPGVTLGAAVHLR